MEVDLNASKLVNVYDYQNNFIKIPANKFFSNFYRAMHSVHCAVLLR